MATATLAVSAQQWMDHELHDPAGRVAELLRRIADDVETTERITVPRRTGRTFDSIHVQEDEDAEGIFERVLSRNPQSSVLNARAGYIFNRSRRGRPHTSGVRRTEPFMRTALFTVSKEF